MKISILTATYNSEKTLRDTLESVLRQTYTDFEHIIIDGCSKDGTLDIIREYMSRYQGHLRFISEPDRGIYDAMNKGIRMPTGEVVGILNSDDFYTSDDVLQVIVDTFNNFDVDAVYGDIHYVNNEDLTKPVRYYSSSVFRWEFMRFGLMPAHPSFYCLKDIYDKYGVFDTSYKIAADFENLLRLLFIHRIKTRYIQKDFVTMRTGGASTESFDSRKQIMRDHLKAMKSNGVYSNFFLLSLRYFYKFYELARGGHHAIP